MGQALQRAVAPVVLPAIAGQWQLEEAEELDQQLLRVNSLEDIEESEAGDHDNEELEEDQKFPDLGHLPPEIAIQVLKNLNATDLCLASCVWQQLASDNILWQGLCRWNKMPVKSLELNQTISGHIGSMLQFTTIATLLIN